MSNQPYIANASDDEDSEAGVASDIYGDAEEQRIRNTPALLVGWDVEVEHMGVGTVLGVKKKLIRGRTTMHIIQFNQPRKTRTIALERHANGRCKFRLLQAPGGGETIVPGRASGMFVLITHIRICNAVALQSPPLSRDESGG